MKVFLLRHGDAADHAPDGSFDDDARELSEDGVERLRIAAQAYVRIIGAGDLRIFHSPLIRAVQSTGILIDAGLSPRSMQVQADLRPSRRTEKVVDLLQGEFLDGAEKVLLVGHEPLLGNLLGVLAAGNERLSLPLSKGMLVQIDLPEPQVMIGRLENVISQTAARHLIAAPD